MSANGKMMEAEAAEKKGSNVVSSAWDWYLCKLDERPVVTKGFSAAVLGMLSEAISRKLRGERALIKWQAYVKQFIIGLIWRPSLHFWYAALNRAFQALNPANPKSLLTLIAKVTVHEIVYHPISTVVYMYALRRLDGNPHSEVTAHVHQHFFEAQKKAYKVWPAMTMLNFLYVPQRLQVLFISAVSVIMNAVLTGFAKH
mmetsp:Transcript_61850/g.113121  ORF Transcript_61850/g.113121 Transcript_61850/m.113121 type:complete len:200 (-) Transcript_61850:84-683(-)